MIQFTCISITRSTSNALTPAQKVHLLISPAKENTCKHHQKTSQVRTNNRLHDINKNSPRQRRQKLGRANSYSASVRFYRQVITHLSEVDPTETIY